MLTMNDIYSCSHLRHTVSWIDDTGGTEAARRAVAVLARCMSRWDMICHSLKSSLACRKPAVAVVSRCLARTEGL